MLYIIRLDWTQYIKTLNVSSGTSGWALKMFDASGKLSPSGILEGSIFFLPGNLDSCLEVEAPAFNGQWCSFWIRNALGKDTKTNGKQEIPYDHIMNMLDQRNLPDGAGDLFKGAQIFTGQCVPDSCSLGDMSLILSLYLYDGLGFYAAPASESCLTRDNSVELDSTDYTVISIIFAFGMLIFVGTIADMSIKHFKLDPDRNMKTFFIIFQGFSLYVMFRKIFHVSENKDNLGCINGIRFLSMVWVIVGHTYLMLTIAGSTPYISNSLSLFANFGEEYGMRFIFNATPSVDSFFLIGAVLLSFLTLQQLEKQNGGSIKFWTMFFVHRYVRLTGVYAMALALQVSLLRHLRGNSYVDIFPYLSEACESSWWTNLLYINNFKEFLHTDDCMGHTWYMANDMQMFLISPILIYAMYKSPIFGIALSSAVTIGSAFYRIWWYTDYKKDKEDFDDLYDNVLEIGVDDQDFMYRKPWARIGPYAIGLIVGCILNKIKNTKIAFTARNISIALIANGFSITILYFIIFFDSESMTDIDREWYNALHRIGWGLGLGMLIITCVKVSECHHQYIQINICKKCIHLWCICMKNYSRYETTKIF